MLTWGHRSSRPPHGNSGTPSHAGSGPYSPTRPRRARVSASFFGQMTAKFHLSMASILTLLKACVTSCSGWVAIWPYDSEIPTATPHHHFPQESLPSSPGAGLLPAVYEISTVVSTWPPGEVHSILPAFPPSRSTLFPLQCPYF